MSEYVDLDALWKVLVAALLGGAGLVAVYSLALVGLSNGRAAGRVVAGLCFLLVAVGIVLGLYVMLAK
ncbi:hypothetical protein DQ384_07380 [Sphaerisporangium album]|uniref:Major facilitator superfamily (MFS) profile domain-containing protein n=1 Tax=Sphaerisporangium album TaxID=509200 RepID=A0A367FPV3_9ACTN|nr:hypothetical protein [Sphaerisporangium album]RCG32311.1 hypothetical protein DQ384_07380 [Sphaerisporangium album]